jgi:hypothetical protein
MFNIGRKTIMVSKTKSKSTISPGTKPTSHSRASGRLWSRDLKFVFTVVMILNSFGLQAQLPSGLKKYFGCPPQNRSNSDSLVFTSDCDYHYNFFNEKLRRALEFDSVIKYMYTTELHIERLKLDGYIVIYENYIGTPSKPKSILTIAQIRKGKLNGSTEVFHFGRVLANLEYKNGLKNGVQTLIQYFQNSKECLYNEYKLGLMNGRSIRVHSNNDTIYSRIYRRGNYKFSYYEKSPDDYPPEVKIKYRKKKR